MGLGAFVAQYVGASIPTGLLPLLVLGCSILVAFATGTSSGHNGYHDAFGYPVRLYAHR